MLLEVSLAAGNAHIKLRWQLQALPGLNSMRK